MQIGFSPKRAHRAFEQIEMLFAVCELVADQRTHFPDKTFHEKARTSFRLFCIAPFPLQPLLRRIVI